MTWLGQPADSVSQTAILAGQPHCDNLQEDILKDFDTFHCSCCSQNGAYEQLEEEDRLMLLQMSNEHGKVDCEYATWLSRILDG